MASIYFPKNGLREKPRSNGLPMHSSAVQEKMQRHSHSSSSWTIPLLIPIPGVKHRQCKLLLPNLGRAHQISVARFGRKKGPAFLCVLVFASLFVVFALGKRFGTKEKQWPPIFTGDKPTLVFERSQLQRIWEWEVASGHYPSHRDVPEQIGLLKPLDNPALDPGKAPTIPSRFRPPPGPYVTTTHGSGSKRVYLDMQSSPPNVAYPPRPLPGSVADLDVIMDQCDFSKQKYVRDCLEVLRLGAGLDNGDRVRRGKMDEWKYIYLEQAGSENVTETTTTNNLPAQNLFAGSHTESDPNAGLSKKWGVEWEPALNLPKPRTYQPHPTLSTPCDDDNNPRLFHMFWTGPFTDKPYLALMSFLFTQNVGIQHKEFPADSPICRPKFWMWINPGPAASVPNPSAVHDMYEQLKSSPWAAPFLHPRFKDVIMFKLWNTTEQLDGVPELKDDWRQMQDSLFNSGGQVIKVPSKKQPEKVEEEDPEAAANATAAAKVAPTGKADEDDLANRTGSKSSSSYDRLSVILSDMARFVLCHRFGGIYLDADTIFLRDWEELWGWQGAFAYRWSRLEKYNTAVLRLHKGSALGSFLFRTALKNGMDFHPMSVALYTKDAYLEPLLLRLPDALFDSAWLNTEYYQRDRPPQPYFFEFADFFDTPAPTGAQPAALGFDGFFKGAFSYHFHNFWWKPFDPSRNFPDLGPRFIAGERAARAALATADGSSTTFSGNETDWDDRVKDDKRDLGWSTVLKRTFEAYVRGERPNMYGEWIQW